jgi:hypothetical protein
VCDGVDWIPWTRRGSLAGFCEHGFEPSDSIKCKVTLGHVTEHQLLKKDFALLCTAKHVGLGSTQNLYHHTLSLAGSCTVRLKAGWHLR